MSLGRVFSATPSCNTVTRHRGRSGSNVSSSFVSPSREPPRFPHSFASSSSIAENDARTAGARDTVFNDITAFSDLSDEIERVEARLWAIKKEEASLSVKQTAPPLPARDTGGQVRGGAMLLDLPGGVKYDVQFAATSSSCQVNSLSDTDTVSTELAAPLCENGYEPGGVVDVNINCMKREMKQLRHKGNLLGNGNSFIKRTASEGKHCDPLALLSSSSSRGFEQANETAKTQMEPGSGTVFSLASFLRPIRVVDVEINTGVYEKLEIFAGESMERVARNFINKHNLNMERAFEPLHTFLSSLKINDSNIPQPPPQQQPLESSTQKTSSLLHNGNRNTNNSVAPPPHRMNHCPSTGMNYGGREYVLSDSLSDLLSTSNVKSEMLEKQTSGRRAVNHVPHQSIRGSITENTVVNNTTTRREEKKAAAVSSVSQKKTSYQHELEHQANTPGSGREKALDNVALPHSHNNKTTQDSRRKKILIERSTEEAKVALAFPIKNKISFDVRKIEATNHTKARARTNSAPKKRPMNGEEGTVYSQCNSTEPCRSLSISRGRKSSPFTTTTTTTTNNNNNNNNLAREESVPTFKPSLAPRGKELAAKNPDRLAGPTYAHTTAHTPRLSKALAKASAECTGKPKILPRKQENASQEAVGKRLYDQAMEQKRRLEERRIREQARRDEEEKSYLKPGPHMNKRRSIHEKNSTSLPSTFGTTRRDSATFSSRRSDPLKSHEERELEECTFTPAINPASVRMFNVVVRGLDVEKEHKGSGGNFPKYGMNSVHGVGNQTQSSETILQNRASVEDRLLLGEQNRRKRLEEERLFRGTVDVATGRQLFRPFLGR